MAVSIGVMLAGHQCHSCGFVSLPPDEMLDDACRNCGEVTHSHALFPRGSTLEIIKSIEHFHSIACEEHVSAWTKSTESISMILGTPVTRARTYRAWREINRRYTRGPEHQAELQFLQQNFRCDPDTAMRLMVALALGSDEPEEMRVVPIMTVTLIETLLNTLLIDLTCKSGHVDPSAARKQISSLVSFKARYELFNSLTGTTLQKATEHFDRSFWSDWEYVRQKRNDFVHGLYYSLGWLACERSWRVTVRSVRVFGQLLNRYVVTPGTAPDRSSGD